MEFVVITTVFFSISLFFGFLLEIVINSKIMKFLEKMF